jgi:hypothetical protein
VDKLRLQPVLWIRIREDPKLFAGSGSKIIIPDPDGPESKIKFTKKFPQKIIIAAYSCQLSRQNKGKILSYFFYN